MVKLNQIYTRTGDEGETGLGDGSRVSKSSRRIEAIGDVDEANAVIGLARLTAAPDMDAQLATIQNDLFDLGADLCMPQAADEKAPPLRIVPAQVGRLEKQIDAMNDLMAPLASFILPGGSEVAARLHFARTVVRRAERKLAALASESTVNPAALHYLNRLSDYLFVAARFANDKGASDVLWVPGKAR